MIVLERKELIYILNNCEIYILWLIKKNGWRNLFWFGKIKFEE